MADTNRPGSFKPDSRASGQVPPRQTPRRSSRIQGRATTGPDGRESVTGKDLLEAGRRIRQARSHAQKQVAFADVPQTEMQQRQGSAAAIGDSASETESADLGKSTFGRNLPVYNPVAPLVPNTHPASPPKPAVLDSAVNRPLQSTQTSESSVGNNGQERAARSHLTDRRTARVQQLLIQEQAAKLKEVKPGAKRRLDDLDEEEDDEDDQMDDREDHFHHRGRPNHHHRARRQRSNFVTGDSDRTPKRLRDDKGNSRPVTHELPDNALVHMLSQLWNGPHVLDIGQISGMFELIQGRIWGGLMNPEKGFVQKHFAFVLNAAQCAAWPLHELKTKHLALYMSTMYLADGSQYGWRSFFTQPQFRQYLVGAILGEWFTQRIFKHTAFGLPQELVDELEETDREYLNFDAVVRTKKRAELLDAKYSHPGHRFDIQKSVRNAASTLANEILAVLQPLLPPPVFDPIDPVAGLCRTNPIRIRADKLKSSLRSTIKQDLEHLILDCAALHMGIRFTGRNGTIVRLVPHLQKGSRFHPTAPMVCLNEDWCNQTIPVDPSEKSELCIKMTCWPRVEAIVPHGPDMDELGFREREYREEMLLHTRTGSSRSEASSESDHDIDTGKHQFTWNGHDKIWPIVPDELQDNEGRQALRGEATDEQGRTNTEKRAAYMTVYACLSPSMVYCEWTPQPRKKGQSLAEAVLEARRTTTGAAFRKYRVEDFRIDLWNTWALYGGLAQWGVIAAGLVISISRYLNIPSHARVALLKSFHGTRQVISAGSVHGPKAVASSFRQVWKGLGPFGTAAAGPLNALIVEPLEHLLSLLDRNMKSANSTLSEFVPGNASLQTVRGVIAEDIDEVLEVSSSLITASIAAATTSLPETLTSTTPETNAVSFVPENATTSEFVGVTTSMENGSQNVEEDETSDADGDWPLDNEDGHTVDQENGEPDEVGVASSEKSQKSRWQRWKESMALIGARGLV